MARSLRSDDKFSLWIYTYNVAALAKALGMTQAIVSAWARRAATPRPKTAAAIIRMAKGELSWSDIYGYLI